MIEDLNKIVYNYLEDIEHLNKKKKCLKEMEKYKYYCEKGMSYRNFKNRYIEYFNQNRNLYIVRIYKYTCDRNTIILNNNGTVRYIVHENLCGNN